MPLANSYAPSRNRKSRPVCLCLTSSAMNDNEIRISEANVYFCSMFSVWLETVVVLRHYSICFESESYVLYALRQLPHHYEAF